MIYTLPDFICLDIFVLLNFLIFCLSDFIKTCQSNVDFVSKSSLSLHRNKIFSLYSPDSKLPSFRIHAWDDLC